MTTVLTQADAQRIAERGRIYRSNVVVSARRLSETQQWVSGGRSELSGSAGDWVLSDGSADWTITDEAFRATYIQRPDGQWVKSSPVRAVELSESVEVQTPEGVSRGDAGDWLVAGSGAGAWPVSAQVFAERYNVAD